jgi:TonB family protein
MKSSLLFALGGLLAIAAAPASPQATLPVVAGAQLTEEQLWAAWPAAARSVGLEASVSITCVISLAGAAENCSATTATKGAGFEAASIALVRSLKFAPATVEGAPQAVATPVNLNFLCGGRCSPFGPAGSTPRPLVLFPAWSKTPTAEEIEAAYPPAAASDGVEGTAVLLCRRTPVGSLEQCTVTEETPAGRGFGEAALRLAANFSGPNGKTLVRASIRFRRGQGRSSAQTLADGETMPPRSPPDPPAAKPAPKAAGPTHFYPEAAQRKEVTGAALMICRVQPDESVASCAVARESPPGFGFGEAAIKMAPLMRIGPRIVDGQEFRDDYRVIPTNFNIR